MIYSDKAKGSFCLRSCYDEHWSLSLYLTLAAISMFFCVAAGSEEPLCLLRERLVPPRLCSTSPQPTTHTLTPPHPHPHMHDTGGGSTGSTHGRGDLLQCPRFIVIDVCMCGHSPNTVLDSYTQWLRHHPGDSQDLAAVAKKSTSLCWLANNKQ